MAQSDITIDALDKVGKDDAEYLVSLVRSVPGFPKEGIIFRDFMPVLADAKGLMISSPLVARPKRLPTLSKRPAVLLWASVA